MTKPRRLQRRQAWHLHPLCRKITDNKLSVCETMRTESLLLNLIINSTQQQFFHWSCFPGMSKLTEREECGDSVSLSFCSSIKDKRHFWVASPLSTYLPTSPLQLLHTAQQLFCDACIPPLCQNPLETRLPLPVIDCHALFIAPKDREEPASLPDRKKVLFSLFVGSHSGRYHHDLLKPRLYYPQQRKTL